MASTGLPIDGARAWIRTASMPSSAHSTGPPSGAGGDICNTAAGALNLTNGTRVTRNSAERGGVGNRDLLTVRGGSAVIRNTPDDCVDSGSGTGCPA